MRRLLCITLLALVPAPPLAAEVVAGPIDRDLDAEGPVKAQARSDTAGRFRLELEAGAASTFPNVGPWVTLRCAGPNGVFDLDPEVDDRVVTTLAQVPEQPPAAPVGFPYLFAATPQPGERCRIYTPGEVGAVPPPAP